MKFDCTVMVDNPTTCCGGIPRGKLLEKQKEGRKMRLPGTVQISTEAFLAALKLDE